MTAMGKSGGQACPVTMKFANFASKKTDKWDSEPFYSHDKGYKLLLNVWPDVTAVVKVLTCQCICTSSRVHMMMS